MSKNSKKRLLDKIGIFLPFFMFCTKMIPLGFRSLNLKTKLNPEAHKILLILFKKMQQYHREDHIK